MELDELAKERGKRYPRRRRLYPEVARLKGKAFTGIVGPRGVGKTVLLRQLALEAADSFYISADTLEDLDLFETAKVLSQDHGVKLLLLDEIHFQRDYAAALKKVFDFLDLRVVFTSSVSLSILESAHDLSRRARLLSMHPFSFGEYAAFKRDISLPPLRLKEILERKWRPEHLRCAGMFEAYLKGGLMPLALEEPDVLPALRAVVEKVVSKDIPSVARLHTDELGKIEKMLRFIGSSSPEGINHTSISRNVGVTKYKAEQYVRLLERAFVLDPVFPAGTNVLREPKVLMNLPFRLLYRDYDQAVGAIREDFTAQTLRMRGLEVSYLKSSRGAKTPDFLVRESGEDIVVEVGGKGKGRRQFKGIRVRKKLVLSHSDTVKGDRRPLFLLGFA